MSFDEELEEELKHVTETDPIKMIRYIILSLTKYVFDNGSGFAKELYISQLSISNNYITQKTRPYYQGVLSYVKKAQEQNIIKNDMDADEITSVLLRIGRGTILDWCLHDYGYDLLQQSKKDLDFMLQQFLITPNT